MDLSAQILATWLQHQETMLFLLQYLPDAALETTLSKRGGRTVGKQLLHLYQVRCMYLESFAKKESVTLSNFEKDYLPSKTELLNAFEQSGNLLGRYLEYCLQEKAGKAVGFKTGVVGMLGYFIAHEAHHRGHLLLTAKQAGIKLPEALKWGLWESK